MKHLFTVLLICSYVFNGNANPVFQKLSEINKCWEQQKDVNPARFPAFAAYSETAWIQLHLSLVEQTLRNRSTTHLSDAQKRNRRSALDYLHNYWQTARFPQNEDYTYRTPIFIDKYNNFCAVGYLVQATGYEYVSRMIAANTNLAYVQEMNYPELFKWANHYGFTIDELAWIQPGYPPDCEPMPIHRGVDGTVNELFVDKTGEKLFVGGVFKMADSTILANNIAYLTYNNDTYTWHNMGTGVKGTVNAIAEYDNKIFIAGSFDTAGGTYVNNIAYWDGTKWHPAGCTFGEVKDLIVFKDKLFAVGKFDVCAAISEINFAKWTGSLWQQFPGITGIINTAEPFGSDLVLGGSFVYDNDTVNAVKWNENDGFDTFTNGIKDEIKDFEVYDDTLFAVCKAIVGNDTTVFLKMEYDTWRYTQFEYMYLTNDTSLSFNTLCRYNDKLMVGGKFHGAVGLTGIANTYILREKSPSGDWFGTGTVNKLIEFKGRLIAGGAMKYDASSTNGGIVYSKKRDLSVNNTSKNDLIKIYPNPITSSSLITVETNFNNGKFVLRDITGRVVMYANLETSISNIKMPALSTGVYTAEIKDGHGYTTTWKLLIN